jgi:6-phosphogluconate dehydrogenase
MNKQKYDLGMIGLGVMGRNLVLNIADHGYAVAGYDKDSKQVQALRAEAEGRDIFGAENIEMFVEALRMPRKIMLLVPAGPVVDAVIQNLLPHLDANDLLIDGGNSHFKDTNRRIKVLAEKHINFLGVGISGGEYGARHGPSIMPGGATSVYEKVRPIFEAIAAKAGGDRCVTYLGPGSAGHFVKMVHNGIEYGLLQLIAETYDLMKRGLGLTGEQLHSIYEQWNKTELNSYLIEITADIFRWIDDKSGKRLVEVILDEAGQKGTGKWASQEAMDLQVSVSTIDAAVAMRDLSDYKKEREAASQILAVSTPAFRGEKKHFIQQLHDALYVGMILTYTQGMALLRAASPAHEYKLNLDEVIRIWRGGCIIRAAMLEDIRSAYIVQPDLPNLLMDEAIAQQVLARQDNLRTVVKTAAELGIPASGLMAALSYFDGYRSAWLPANLTQAQRDYFGAHTYQRIDEKGVFHTEWHLE